MSGFLLSLDKVSKTFGRVQAVRNASFSLRRAALTGFLGENGAGKTTTIKMILGFLAPDSGTIVRNGGTVGYVPEQPAFSPWLTGAALLGLTARAYRLSRAVLESRTRDAARVLGFDEGLLSRPARTYSLGNHKKFAYLQSLVLDPDVFVVDEPFAALDPLAIRRVRELFLDLKGRGRTLLLSSHLLAELEKVCDDVVIIRRGEVVYQGVAGRGREGEAGLERLFLEYAGRGGG
jgi:ABC-type multidrug transport system ATPase subunit